MRTVEFLSHLRDLDVHLTVENGRLGCNAPKGVLTAELKAELKARKAEIVEFLSQASRQAFSEAISHLVGQAEFVPSFAQQRLWFLDRLGESRAAYNIAGGLRFRGTLDRPALEKSLREILSRHQALRTSIVSENGSPKAIVRPLGDWTLEQRSLAVVPEEKREEELAKIACAHAGLAFDLASSPLMRACLVELSPLDHALLISMHHIAADGWSLPILAGELAEFYPAFLEGRVAALPDLPIQYGDYAVWHRRSLEGGLMQAEMPYWKKKLAGPLPHIELPGDHPRRSGAGARLRRTLPKAVSESVRALSRSENATPFTVLLAAFQVFLSRYTRQTDIIVGTATAGRNRPELEKLIGLFINNLVLRTDLSGDPSVRELLGRVQETTLNAFSHENVPLDLLAGAIQPNRDLSRPPLFQVMFVMQNFAHAAPALPGLTVTPFEIDTGAARFDLTVDVIEKDGRFDLRWEYNAGLFEASTIERMQDHYTRLLEALIAHPELRLSQLPMLSAAEERELVLASEGPPTDSSQLLPVPALIERQALRSPDAVAIAFGGERVTYRELNARAGRLARRLRSLGVERESLVALCLEPSVGMVVALLAVLKAGGAYIPLDPDYPRSRLDFMLEDSQAAVLITEERFLPFVPAGRLRVVCLDRDEAESDEPLPEVSLDSLAYVIYTSGSTGRPKGVEITHRSLANLLLSMQREPGIGERDRLLAVTTLSFDIAGLEIYLPLITGACLVLAPRSARADGAALAHLLRESGATMMQATPALWRLLLDSGWMGLPGLKILCGGEALPRELADRLLDAGAEVWNLYGPTETTIWSTIHRVAREAGPVPIGRPIANTRAYVLDDDGRIVPSGVPGELFLGGDGVARGYLRRPALTAEKFVADPFHPGERLYRTGDLVVCRPETGIEYLGRLDQQVKLRGFRIELEEIETALREQSSIQDAAVVVREPAPGDQRLVAFVVARDRAQADARQIREALLARLPEYMVPSRFVFLDALPLTPNRKLDRAALPALAPETDAAALYVPPRTEQEREVAAIWADLLKQERIGIHDNFFDLGGHSLLAVQLQSRLMRRFQREIPIVELFQRPTVAAIASLLNSGKEAAAPA